MAGTAVNVAGAQKVLGTNSTISTDLWARAFLTSINAPITTNNLTNVKIWLANEQSASSWAKDFTNPLGVEGAGQVSATPNALDGIILTASTLLGNAQYQGVVNSLRYNAPTPFFTAALVPSGWNTKVIGGVATYNGKTAAQLAKLSPLNASVDLTGELGQIEQANAQYLSDAYNFAAGNTDPLVTVPASALNGVKSIATSVPNFLGDLTNPTYLKNVGIFVLGGALALTGLLVFFATTKTGETAISTGAKVAT